MEELKEGEGDLRMMTLDCLRGRLLAERQASKVAQQQAQFMANKLMEIEDKLIQETKLRKKAVKKLNLLTKKLQSLEISPTLLSLLKNLHSSSDDSSDQISGSSSSGSSNSKSQLDEHQHSSSSTSYSSTPKIRDCEDSNVESQSGSSISEEGVDKEMDNSLALVVPVISLGTSKGNTHELVTVNKNVSEVLAALKDAREKIIQNSVPWTENYGPKAE